MCTHSPTPGYASGGRGGELLADALGDVTPSYSARHGTAAAAASSFSSSASYNTSDDDDQQNPSQATPPVTIVEPPSAVDLGLGLGGLDAWSLPSAATSSKSITPPNTYTGDATAADPFAYTSTLAPSYDLGLNNTTNNHQHLNSFGGLLFNGGVGLVAPPALYGPTRRWSLTDPSAASSTSLIESSSSQYQSQQRPWTSIASAGNVMGGLGLGSFGHGHGHGGASCQPSTTLSPDPANAHHHAYPNQNTNALDVNNNNSSSSSLYRTYSNDSSPMAPSFSSSNSNASRPSTSSSFQSIGTPQGESFFLAGYGDAGDASYVKRRVSSSSSGIGAGGATGFYGLGLEGGAGGNESTDTICLPPTSSHGQPRSSHGLGQQQRRVNPQQQHAQPASAPPSSTSFFQPQQPADDSNPFYFARELQLLQAQSHRQFDATSLPHPIRQQARPSSGYLEPLRPTSGYHEQQRTSPGYLELQSRPTSSYLEPQAIHPSLQTAIASTSPNDQYLFFEGQQVRFAPF